MKKQQPAESPAAPKATEAAPVVGSVAFGIGQPSENTVPLRTVETSGYIATFPPQSFTFTVPPSVSDTRALRCMSVDHLRALLIRITGRAKQLIDAIIQNEAQAKAVKDQMHLNVWMDYDVVDRYAVQFMDEERKQSAGTGSTWRPPFPF